jgi:hypothetical protein
VILRAAPGSTLGYRILLRAAGPDVPETRSRLDRMEISASRTGDLVQFSGALPRAATAVRGLEARFEIAVPAGIRVVDATTGAGDIDASGVSGTVGLVTQGGTITARDLPGPLTAETRGGGIDVAALGGSATLITAGGDVTVGRTHGPLVVQFEATCGSARSAPTSASRPAAAAWSSRGLTARSRWPRAAGTSTSPRRPAP